jgi:hypothetical protein
MWAASSTRTARTGVPGRIPLQGSRSDLGGTVAGTTPLIVCAEHSGHIQVQGLVEARDGATIHIFPVDICDIVLLFVTMAQHRKAL